MLVYLDESGDLGFDFESKRPSKFFVITVLVIIDKKSAKIINNSVTRTLDKKINYKKKSGKIISELKGSSTTLENKKYFLSYIEKNVTNFSLYSIILDKYALFSCSKNLIRDRIYNQMTYQLLEQISFPNRGYINLIVDRSKNSLGIKEFNDYLYTNLNLCLNLEIKLYISHDSSEKNKGIQAVDMLCYGIARKYELKDQSRYDLFKKNIKIECMFQAGIKKTAPAMCNSTRS